MTAGKWRLIIPAVLGALWLCAFALLVATESRSMIRENTAEITAECQTIWTMVKDAAAGNTADAARIAAYQQAMTGEAGACYFSASVLLDRDGNPLCRSRNSAVAVLTRQQGEPVTLPLAFLEENTTDIAALLHGLPVTVSPYDPNSSAGIYGEWEDGLFYVTELTGGDLSYRSETDGYNGKEILHYEAEGRNTGSDFSGLTVTPIMKSCGGIAPAKGWERTDRLISQLETMTELKAGGELFAVQDSLFHQKLVWGCLLLDDRNPFSEGNSLQFIFGAEFSPIALALKETWRNGSAVVLLLLFLTAGVGLTMILSYRFDRATQLLRDELARQAQMVNYAKHAEQARQAMTSAIAHELKTPIAVMSSYAEALQEHIDPEKQSYYLDVIRQEADRVDRMVLELLDLSRLEAGRYQLRRESFRLSALVEEILRPLEGSIHEKQLEVSMRVGQDQVYADRMRFGQVVENFMTNAIRHTPPGGKILIRIGMGHETFSVENQGSAIPEGQLGRVWENFWQGDEARSGRGTGLGLAICRSILTLHGGTCRVENTAIGVRFTADLTQRKVEPVTRLCADIPAELHYPLYEEHTTVAQVMFRLALLRGGALRREIRGGCLTVDGRPVTKGKQQVYPGNVLLWREVQILLEPGQK